MLQSDNLGGFMEIREQYTHTDPVDGSVHVVEQEQHIAAPAERAEAHAWQATNVVWYIVTLLELIVSLRFILLLFGANNTGFASFIYSISSPLVSMFNGIFHNPAMTGGTFDSASLIALVVIMLVGWAIVGLIDLALHPSISTHTHQLR